MKKSLIAFLLVVALLLVTAVAISGTIIYRLSQTNASADSEKMTDIVNTEVNSQAEFDAWIEKIHAEVNTDGSAIDDELTYEDLQFGQAEPVGDEGHNTAGYTLPIEVQ